MPCQPCAERKRKLLRASRDIRVRCWAYGLLVLAAIYSLQYCGRVPH